MSPISAQPKEKATTGGPFDRTIEKCNKAIKLHSIKAKPARKAGWRNNAKQLYIQEKEEYNPFLKNCWLLLGQAQFYNADFLQSSATFSYIARHYAVEKDVATAAKLWQARCYQEMGWLYDSEDIFTKLNKTGIPKQNLQLYSTVYADYIIKNNNHKEAIPWLSKAIKAEPRKIQRCRMKYLLGQLYAEQGNTAEAYKTFGQVAHMNPPYELEFAARIRQSEVFAGTNYQREISKLKRMAHDQKNKDLLDQVYYAIGNLYLIHKDTTQALVNYNLAINKSTQNGFDKAICQIKLGDLYFGMHDYIKAQPCFSGALSAIQKTYKDYVRISKLSPILDELVVHASAVHLQDSLQTVAKMPEKERLALIDSIIEKYKKDEELAKKDSAKAEFLARQEAQGTGINRPGMDMSSVKLATGSGGSFYFYNPQVVADGKTQFQRKWGRRVLEDNWRRRKKEMSTFNENKELAQTDTTKMKDNGGNMSPDSLEKGLESAAASDPKTREYYLQQLPLTPEDVDASNVIIEDGLYNMAMIYKDKLEDLPLSISAFEELERRFPDNQHKLESFYQVYLMSLRQKNAALSKKYLAKLQKDFPKQDYTIAVSDPNYEENIRTMDIVQDSIYQVTYKRYLAEDTVTVRRNYALVSTKYPLAVLIPKFMFLDALTYVQAGDAQGFKTALKALLDKYPKADVSGLAGDMLKGLLRGRQLSQGSITGMTWDLRFGLGEGGSLSASDSARTFKDTTNVPYQVILMYPTGSIDRNQLLFTVAAFNFANALVKELDLSFDEAGTLSMLKIQGFSSLSEVIHYYKLAYGKDGYASKLPNDIFVLPISENNYETLMRGKTLDEYITFFNEHYGKDLPEVVAHWQARNENTQTSEQAPLPKEEVEETPEEPIQEAQKPVQEKKKKSIRNTLKTPEQKAEEKEKENNIPNEDNPILGPTKKEINVTPVPTVKDTIAKPTVKESPAVTDTIVKPAVQESPSIVNPTPTQHKDLTLEEIQAIHKQQADAKAAAEAEAQKAKDEAKAAKEKAKEDAKAEKVQPAKEKKVKAAKPKKVKEPKKEKVSEQVQPQQQPVDTAAVLNQLREEAKQQPPVEVKPKKTVKPKKEKVAKEAKPIDEAEALKQKQKEEDARLLKEKEEQEKTLSKQREEQAKQQKEELKARQKAREELQKEKAKERKEQLKLKEQERKNKEKAYKEKLKQKEQEQKAKEKAYKEQVKQKEAERKAAQKGKS